MGKFKTEPVLKKGNGLLFFAPYASRFTPHGKKGEGKRDFKGNKRGRWCKEK